jgi:hypothetical protein
LTTVNVFWLAGDSLEPPMKVFPSRSVATAAARSNPPPSKRMTFGDCAAALADVASTPPSTTAMAAAHLR